MRGRGGGLWLKLGRAAARRPRAGRAERFLAWRGVRGVPGVRVCAGMRGGGPELARTEARAGWVSLGICPNTRLNAVGNTQLEPGRNPGDPCASKLGAACANATYIRQVSILQARPTRGASQRDARRAAAEIENATCAAQKRGLFTPASARSGRFTVKLLKSLHTAGADSLLLACARLWAS
jgi:hypothetical protein